MILVAFSYLFPTITVAFVRPGWYAERQQRELEKKRWWPVAGNQRGLAPDWELHEGRAPFPSSGNKPGAEYKLSGWVRETYYLNVTLRRESAWRQGWRSSWPLSPFTKRFSLGLLMLFHTSCHMVSVCWSANLHTDIQKRWQKCKLSPNMCSFCKMKTTSGKALSGPQSLSFCHLRPQLYIL